MRPAAWRWAVLLFAAGMGAAGSCAAADEFPLIRQGGIEWITVRAAAARLGLADEPDLRGREIEWTGGGQHVRLQAGSREVMVNGLRIFLGQPVLERGGGLYLSLADFDRRLLVRIRPGLCRIRPRPVRVIAIDPGHGGEDHGAENRRLGLMEKTFTLDVSFRLRRLLESAGYRVVLTRTTDVDVPKPTRAEIANTAGADLFVSVHFNSLEPDTRTTGVEVLTFPLQGQRPDASWGPGHADDSERQASPINRFDPWNAVLAGALHGELLRALHSPDRGEKTEHLRVLRPLDCPGALVEPAFLSNDAEARRLSTADGRQRIAEALAEGIKDYAATIQALNPVPPAAAAAPPSRERPTRPPGIPL